MSGLRHIGIRTRDIERSRRFYEQGLGMRFLGYRPARPSLDLSDGVVNVTLIPYEGPERASQPEGDEFVHLGFLVDDLAQTYQRLLALGAEVVRHDVKQRYAPTAAAPVGSFKVLDPDGIVLDVSERPEEWRTI